MENAVKLSESKNQAIESLRQALPPIIWRADRQAWRLLPLSPRTVANRDSLGEGPSGRVVLRGRVGYERDALLAWLAGRA